MARSAKSSDIGGHRLRINSRFAYDDFMLEPLKGREARELLELVEARYRRGSLILCSQYGPSGWHERIGEGALADAVIDRKCEASHFRSNAKSYVMRSPGRRARPGRSNAPANFA